MMREQTILIADDDADLVNLLAFQSRQFGLRVLTAHDARSALQTIDRERPDIVMLDVNMPGGNGLGVREMMMNNDQLKSIPAIVLTGQYDEDTVRRSHNSLAYYVLKCPGVWSRIEPVLREIVSENVRRDRAGGGEEPSSGPTSTEQAGGAAPAAYQDSDQKALFDWMFDLMDTAVPNSAVPIYDEAAADVCHGPWVLCIDDDDELTRGLQLRLREHGVEMLRASAGMEGYRHAFLECPQAIILDFEMPDGNGDYVLRRIKESPATREIPVIVLTGRKGHNVERTMYNLGADAFFTKPCPWDKLWGTLQKYLETAFV